MEEWSYQMLFQPSHFEQLLLEMVFCFSRLDRDGKAIIFPKQNATPDRRGTFQKEKPMLDGKPMACVP
jgi:hypothetical protein